jgi:predicted amidohydrolase
LSPYEKPLNAAFVIHQDGSLGIYAKQHLHPGEEQYFSAGDGGDRLHIADTRVALSVCVPISVIRSIQSHASEEGAQLYAASVLIGETG